MKKLLLGLLLFVLCFTGTCIAIDDFTVTDSVYDSKTKSFSMIINDNRESGNSPNNADASIEGVSITDVELKAINETDVPVTFVFVVDTTTTAYSDQKTKPFEIAEAISGLRTGKKDQYYLISFDTAVHPPVGPKEHPGDILRDISYSVAGVGDYSEALQKAIKLLDSENNASLTKKVIVFISDGHQVSNPRYSEGSLLSDLRDAGYPVFSCGLLQSESTVYVEKDLKKMSEISSETGGLFFSYKTNQTPGRDIANFIARSVVLSGTIGDSYTKEEAGPAEVNIRLKRNQSDITTVNANITITEPIIAFNSAPVQEDPCIDNPNDPACKLPEPSFTEKIQAWLQNTLGSNWPLILIAGGLLIALIILIILTVTKKENDDAPIEEVPLDDDKGNDNKDDEDDEKTNIIVKYNIGLEDLSTGKRYTASLSDGGSVVFGRLNDRANGVIGIGGDAHIGRKQFMLSATSKTVMIEDLGSVNGTYLNGDRIHSKCEIKNGYRIRIGSISGEREYSIMIRKES